MATRSIVKAFDVSKNITSGFLTCCIMLVMDEFGFEGVEEASPSKSAAAKGASIFEMMDVFRHKSVDTLRGYVRDAELFKDHAGAGLL